MTSRERILAALALKQPDCVPFADDFDYEVKVELMGSENFTEIEFARKLGLDAVEISGYSAPIFCKRERARGRDFIVDGLIKTEKDLDLMVFPDPYDESFYDPAKRFIEKYGKEDFAMYTECRWGVDGVLFSMWLDTFFRALYKNPKLVEAVLDRYVEWNCIVIEKLSKIGLDFIISYNSIAYNKGTMISPEMFREIFLPKLKIIADECKLPWVYHSSGNIMPIFDDLLTLGMNGMHPIQSKCMDIKEVKKKYGDKICLWGNIDLSYTLTKGTPKEVEREVKHRINEIGTNGGYILGSSDGLPNYCKKENVWAMAKAVKKHGKYPIKSNL